MCQKIIKKKSMARINNGHVRAERNVGGGLDIYPKSSGFRNSNFPAGDS